MSEYEFYKAQKFLTQQFVDYQETRGTKTLSSISISTFKRLLPFHRPPIHDEVETPNSTRNLKSRRRKGPTPAIVGFMDPILARLMMSKLYKEEQGPPPPGQRRDPVLGYAYDAFTYESVKSLNYYDTGVRVNTQTEALMNLEVQACWFAIPFAAVLSDTSTYIDSYSESDSAFKKSLTNSSYFYTSSSMARMPVAFNLDMLERLLSKRTIALIFLAGSTPGSIPMFHGSKSRKPTDLDGLLQGETLLTYWKTGDEESRRLDISKLDASYICSGPYRLMLTTRPDRHLYLDDYRRVHIFWDFNPSNPGRSLGKYKGHFFWDEEGQASL
jgi:hypothetical protein